MFTMVSICLFCSLFTLLSVQTVSMFLILMICFMYMSMFYWKMSSWTGFWFFISYNSGILVLLLYMSSMSLFKKDNLLLFFMNMVFLMMMLKFIIFPNFELCLKNTLESHFMILEEKNILMLFLILFLIVVVLMFITLFMHKSKTPSRLMLSISLYFLKHLTHN